MRSSNVAVAVGPDGSAPELLSSMMGAPVPLYYRLREALLARLRGGEFALGDPFPPERELIALYGVSRTTVREAVLGLIRDGLLVRQRGKGTIVAAPRLEDHLGALTGFSEQMAAMGLRAGARVLSIETVPLPPREASLLGRPEGELAYRIVRLRLADGIPMQLETTTFPHDIGLRLTQENLGDTGYYAILEGRFGIRLHAAEQTMQARLATAQEVQALELPPGSPVLVQERVTWDAGGRAIELAHGVFRADRYLYRVRLQRLPAAAVKPAASG